MKSIFLAIAILLSVPSFTQTPDTIVLQKIIKEATSNSHLSNYAYQLIDKGPRLTNSPGHHKAINTSIELLKQAGIENVTRESWGEFGKGWQNDYCVAAVTAPYQQVLTAYPVPWTASCADTGSVNIILLDGDDSAAVNKAGNLKGTVVILNTPDSTFKFSKSPEGKRYSDSELVQLKERRQETPESWAGLKAFIARRNAFRKYLQSKGVAALLSDDGRGS